MNLCWRRTIFKGNQIICLSCKCVIYIKLLVLTNEPNYFCYYSRANSRFDVAKGTCFITYATEHLESTNRVKKPKKKKWFNTRVSVIHWSYDTERGSRTSTSAHHYTNKLQAKNSRGIWRNLLDDFKAVARRMQHMSHQQRACLYTTICFLISIVSLQYSQS